MGIAHRAEEDEAVYTQKPQLRFVLYDTAFARIGSGRLRCCQMSRQIRLRGADMLTERENLLEVIHRGNLSASRTSTMRSR